MSWFWRYACPNYPCYAGGNVSAALAFSYNAANFTAFGQFPFPPNSVPSSRSPLGAGAGAGAVAAPVGRGPLNNTDIGSAAYGHTYTVFANKTAGALSCQAECDADTKCTPSLSRGSPLPYSSHIFSFMGVLLVLSAYLQARVVKHGKRCSSCGAEQWVAGAAWTYVRGGECCGKERCCRHATLGCAEVGSKAVGCVSGAKKAGPCGPPAPTPGRCMTWILCPSN